MDDRVIQFRVGVVVLATFLILAILIMRLGGISLPWGKGTYTVFVELPQAPGITVGTPVRDRGIRIGEVTDVAFTDDAKVLVTVRINDDVKLPSNELCRVKGTLLGDAVLDFVPGSGPPVQEFLKDGDQIEGVVFSNPLEILAGLEGNLTGALDSISAAGDEAANLARRIDALVEDNSVQFDRLLEKSETALDGITAATKTFDKLFGDEQLQQDLRQGMADLPKLMIEAHATMAAIQKTMETADTNIRNLEGFTRPLGERGETLIAKIESSLTHLDVMIEQLSIFSQAVNNREGTLGQLVHNPELYQNLNRAVNNVESVSRQLRPIVNDVRIFTDKIARDPSRLGVRGVLRKPTGIK